MWVSKNLAQICRSAVDNRLCCPYNGGNVEYCAPERTAMELSQSLTDEQLALERVADRILETFPPDPDRPAYTERQLARHGNRMVVVSIYSLSESMVAEPQEFRDELRFLMSVTRLRPEQRRCLRLWVDGWNQWEIAEAYGVEQQTISYRIRRALRACYDSQPLSFRRFS